MSDGKMITIVANGTPRTVRVDCSLVELLSQWRLRPDMVVIERNGEPVPRASLGEVRLRDGDRLEIAQMVGGG
jgi:thiazole synthase